MQLDLLNIILDIILILIVLYFALIKSYFQEKGKNLATKEDIEEITSKVESIKNEVSFINQQRTEYYKSQKMALLDFLDESIKHTQSSLRVFERLSKDYCDVETISDVLKEMKIQMPNVSTCFYRIFIYFKDETTQKISKDYYDSILELHNKTLYFLIQLISKANQYNSLFKTGANRYEIEKDKEEIETMINSFIGEKEKLEDAVHDHRIHYIALVSNRLKIKIKKDVC